MKKLPQWVLLLKHFPNKAAGEVFLEIGGKVKLNYDIGVFKNACATRISKALNFSGDEHKIPFLKITDSNNVVQVSSGGKKNFYIYRVNIIALHLKGRYGPGRQVETGGYQ